MGLSCYKVNIEWIELPEIFDKYVNINKHYNLTDYNSCSVRMIPHYNYIIFDFGLDPTVHELKIFDRVYYGNSPNPLAKSVSVFNSRLFNFISSQIASIDPNKPKLLIPYMKG